jgi:hypothetical protein
MLNEGSQIPIQLYTKSVRLFVIPLYFGTRSAQTKVTDPTSGSTTLTATKKQRTSETAAWRRPPPAYLILATLLN